MATDKILKEIPIYLRPYVAKQDPSLYTPMDHASWRFILKISRAFFAKYAHQKYLDGLSETGISMDRIPLIQEMDERLKRFNWRAVPVVGFIPPAVFMEFLSLGVLPIACDMRTIEHLAYTPAPDIVHEAAGHAPIVADPEYAAYLRTYGEVSRKAIFSKQDMEVYQAIRFLSDTKENPQSTDKQVREAQTRLDQALASLSYDSEATLLSRMGWWTFEYGLIGNLSSPKIYGAGLLSSIGESYHCLGSKVKKIPFSIDCIHVHYDITCPQPQLFVVSDFNTLKKGLSDLASQMAFKKGSIEGLKKARKAGTVTTVVLDTGVQTGGILVDFIKDQGGRPCFVKFQGPVQIAYGDREIQGQGATYHREGFSSPIEKISDSQLKAGGFKAGKKGFIRFSSGITLEGKLISALKNKGKNILLTFEDCTVKKEKTILFQPEWGKFDMICGEKVESVFGGAADRGRYFEDTGGFHQEPRSQKTNLTKKNSELNILYRDLRKIREAAEKKKNLKDSAILKLENIYQELKKRFPRDWLLRYELLELCKCFQWEPKWKKSVETSLLKIAKTSPADIAESIQRGLDLL